MNGVLVVDKPLGPTSHDVVAKARRALRTRAIGHAGTLDPMATGVLVLAIGEATKLVPYLTADDKSYEARILLGSETDTLDAEGTEIARSDVPAGIDVARVEAAARSFLGETMQVPPIYSAIKKDGESLHAKARRGEHVAPDPRPVLLRSFEVRSVDGPVIELALHVGKGFYVRSFARDLAAALGTHGHLVGLRRTSSGTFSLADALPLEALTDPDRVRGAVLSLAEACRGMPRLVLSASGLLDAKHGRPVALATGLETPWSEAHEAEEFAALLDAAGHLVAIARLNPGACLRIVRGFHAPI